MKEDATKQGAAAGPPLRVLLLLDGLWVGGAERSLVELLPHLAAREVEPVVACLTRRREGVEVAARRQGADLRFLPPGGLVTQVRGLRRLVDEVRPALVHSSLFRANLVARLARPGLRAGGWPVRVVNSLVSTSYAPVRFTDPAIRPWKLRTVQLADAATARLADGFHAVSEAVRAAAIRDLRLPPERIRVVYRGRSRERLGEPSAERRAAARETLELPRDAEVVVNVGREDFPKGQDVLLEAFARLAPGRPSLHLLLVGRPGSLTRHLDERLRRLPQASRVHRLGHREDVPELLAASDVFAFPSRYEGLPGAVLEAFALALPVVAADVPAVRELLAPPPEEGTEPLGRCVPKDDPAALAQAVEAILDDPEGARASGRRNRRTFLAHHTLEATAPRMVEFYRRVAAGSV